MKKLKISILGKEWVAGLRDTPTANAIYDALPLNGEANVWGGEIYFEIPVKVQLEEDAKEEIEEGDLAFWPVSPVFCIFFGKTPVSTSEKPQAYSAVNVFGSIIEGNLNALFKITSGSQILVEKYRQ